MRAQNSGQNAYVGLYYWNYGSPELMLFKRTGGAWTQLGSAYNSGPLAAGTQLQLKAAGSTISFLQNGVPRSPPPTPASPAARRASWPTAPARSDNWSGGRRRADVTTVGGTVSGLSGTVVLQDNGGDNLSVAANGPFTFATALAGGRRLRVTVKTNPSGQTCTVSGGSGTVGSANVTNVAVSCVTTPTYHGGRLGVGAVVGDGWCCRITAGDHLSVSANGPVTSRRRRRAGPLMR